MVAAGNQNGLNRDVHSHAQAGPVMPFLVRLIDLYSLVVFVAVILSWVPVDRRNPLVTVTQALTEPVLAPIRKVLPPMGGLDLSPMVLLIALQILKGLLY
jgi:YggT family protein